MTGQDNRNGMTELARLGAQLKALREAQGLSYEDVSEATHVRPHIIKAIESGAIEEVSAPVYARGFIKTYCEYLMASDLWKKYSQGAHSSEDSGEAPQDTADEPMEIQHPTPMFQRSSIIWVYMILVVAVLGAAYLLWNQHREESRPENVFALRYPDTSGDNAAVSSDEAPAVSSDLPPVFSGDISSSDLIVPVPEPQSLDSAVSGERREIAPGDISWMDAPPASERSQAELPVYIDRTLLIEITGSNNRLTVEQNGKVLTRRTLSIGGRRSYDVNTDTKVAVSSGSKARVTWFGKRYDSIGADNQPITLVFRPDGSVQLVSGKSLHFSESPSDGG
ncbi:MAG: helix-turn-helix domain-containing protein [Synergistaceae bacterium]|jgi:transcriptional regulator with XRE-family HTH domain|nr:helix-turn-helix domain-containing protein [Synergistaceae bacterium]